MDRRWKMSEMNRVSERKKRPAAINAWGRKMHARRNVQRKRRKSCGMRGRGGTNG